MEKLTPNADYFGRDSLQVETPDFIYDMALLSRDQSVVGQIVSGPKNGFSLLLGDLVGQYGAPCQVSYSFLASGGVQIALNFSHFAVVTPRFDFTGGQILGFWGLAPQMPIEYAYFNFLQDNCLVPEQVPPGTTTVRWHGFTRF